MTGRKSYFGAALAATLGWAGWLSLYVVQQADQALLVRFGSPVASVLDPGLHLKLPIVDEIVVFPRQLLSLEPPVEKIILGDQKRIEAESYAKFKIVDPLRFYQSFGTEEHARDTLSLVVSTALRKNLGTVPLSILLTKQRDNVMAHVQADATEAVKAYGVEIANVQLRRADLPVETSQAIYDRMMSERFRQAKELRAQGFEISQQIRAKAERERSAILSSAQKDAQEERGRADAAANRVVAGAISQDADFFEVYRTMQLYRSAFSHNGPILVLSPKSELMRFFSGAPDLTDHSQTPSDTREDLAPAPR
jgi:modulator of FtsH protease HflC